MSSKPGDDPGVIVYLDDEPSIAPAKGLESLRRGKTPTRDVAGRMRFTIHLRENVVKNNKKFAKDLPAAIPVTDKRHEKDKRSWHRPEMRHLVNKFEKEYGFEAIAMTSWIGSTMTADLTEAVADAIARDERVYEVTRIYEDDRLQFSAAPWYDTSIGGELLPWGREAVGVIPSDGQTSSVPIYIVDRTPQVHQDLATNIVAGVNYAPGGWLGGTAHGTFVTGVISAKKNGSFIRGVNPDASNVFNIEIGGKNPYEVTDAFDWSLAHSEATGTYGVINFSLNSQPERDSNGAFVADPPSQFRYDESYGRLMKRASNRSLVVQSAGNASRNACVYAYCSALVHGYTGEQTQNAVDGIVVVGGINAQGAIDAPYINASFSSLFVNEEGSNFGHCVELWAPSSTTSLAIINGVQTTAYAKGTSFAAPHVSAVAARIGNASLTPVQREAHLRARAKFSGGFDPSYNAINLPTFNATPAFLIPNRLTVANISATSSTSNSDLWSTQDGLHLSGNYWNAGSPVGSIQFDLGSVKTITSIRLIPEMSASGRVRHEIWVGDSLATLTRKKAILEHGELLSPIAHPLGDNVQGRFVLIRSDLTIAKNGNPLSPAISWVSWREVEIYGH